MVSKRCNRIKKDGTKCCAIALKLKDHCRFHVSSPIAGVESLVEKQICDDPNCPSSDCEEMITLKCHHKIHSGCLMLFVKERSAGIQRCPNCKLLLDKPSMAKHFRESLKAFSENLISLSELKILLKQ